MEKIKVFTVAFVLTLLVIVPVFILAGAFQYANISLPADNKIEKVAINVPKIGDARNIMLIQSQPTELYMLLRFDALGSKISVMAISPQTPVMVQEQSITLSEAYDYAGPALAMNSFCDSYGLKAYDYISIDKAQLSRLAQTMQSPATDFVQRLSGPLAIKTAELIAAKGYKEISPPIASELVDDDLFSKQERLELQTEIYAEYLRINYRSLSVEPLSMFKELSPQLKTNIDAKKLYTYSRIFTLLSGARTELFSAPLEYVETEDNIIPQEASLKKMHQMFE